MSSFIKKFDILSKKIRLYNMNGWIKLHRKFRDNSIYTNSHAVHVWIECLLRASHQPKEFYMKRTKIFIKEGQFIMGRSEFGKSIGMSGSTAWFWINEFEKLGMVDSKKTAQGTIITILNWTEHQTLDSKKTANEQQMNTNKKVKKVKNDKKELRVYKDTNKYKYREAVSMTEKEYHKLLDRYGKKMTEGMIEILNNYKKSKGKKYKSDYHAILSWVVKAWYEKGEKKSLKERLKNAENV